MKTITGIAILSIGLFLGSCSSNQDPATYNNKLMTLMNNNETQMDAMNTAMSDKDYAKAEDIRKSWENQLDDAIKTAKGMDAFKNNTALRDNVASGLSNYKKLVSGDYKMLIALRAGSEDTVGPNSEDSLLTHINDVLQKTANDINKASADFEMQSK